MTCSAWSFLSSKLLGEHKTIAARMLGPVFFLSSDNDRIRFGDGSHSKVFLRVEEAHGSNNFVAAFI